MMQKAFHHSLSAMQKARLPLVVKSVGTLDHDAVLRLPSADPRPLAFISNLMPYLYDSSKYAALPTPVVLKVTGFSTKEEQLMEGQKFKVLSGEPRGAVYGFKVGQYFKNSCRPVWNCYIKAHFQSQIPHYHLQSQERIYRQLFRISSQGGTILVQFDMKAYYDQFGLQGDVPSAFCFRGRNGATFALTRLPMGFNLACAIAQGTTWQLLNFDRKSEVFTCIDNIAFAGRPEDVLHDVTQFFTRISAVGATLNELEPHEITAFLQSSADVRLATTLSWHKDVFTFLGVQYYWKDQLRGLSEKTVVKLEALHGCLREMNELITPRQLATIIGVIRYACRVCESPPLDFFDLMAWSRRVASHLQEDPARWDSSYISLPTTHKQQLLSLLSSCQHLAPIPMGVSWPSATPPTVIVDASGIGWGAVVVAPAEVRSLSGKWKDTIHSSVEAEPRGALEAIIRAFPDPQSAPPVVQVLTDHLPLVWAAHSSMPKAFFYNLLLLQLRNTYPSTKFVFAFLPGRLNLADALSRDLAFTLDPIKAREIAGTGWDSASNLLVSDTPCGVCDRTDGQWQC